MKEIKKYQEIKKTLANRIYRSMHFEESESDASESENCEIPSLDSIETNCIWAVYLVTTLQILEMRILLIISYTIKFQLVENPNDAIDR